MSNVKTTTVSSRGRLAIGVLLVAATVIAVVAVRSGWWKPSTIATTKSDEPQPEASGAADRFPLTPISTSPYENTRGDVKYVGSAVCQSCHEEEHESFRHTGMGRSMAKVDLDREPADGQFVHLPSKRRYQVVRRDGRMWHRELLITDGPEEVIVSEFPVKYVTGSGRHSLTYLVETDGFLVESPITWYRSRDAWGMSPGYDRPDHSGFQREVGEGCLICHAGRAEAIDGSLHRMRIIEESIGCERCHGPGSLHVEKRSAGTADDNDDQAGIDYTIVNPKHLSRELAEAVCQQCHLRANSTIISRGREAADYKPGLPLQDFRQDYWLDSPDKEMTVVGHVEQMHLSACYQGSDKFTCATCHNPHGEPPAEERLAHYQTICLSCHAVEQCGVDPQRLARESAENDCTKCHMPTSDTDIPHLAFTHHRVGLHDADAEEKKAAGATAADSAPGVLKPFLDLSRLSPIDQKRSLGLAYLELAVHEETLANRIHYQKESLRLLSEVNSAGLEDGNVSASLASLRFDLGMGEVLPYAWRAMEDDKLQGMQRSNALFLIADHHYQQGQYVEAIMALETLSRVRRHSVQWQLRAQCEQALKNEQGVVEALLTSIKIQPRNPSAHRYLADHFRKLGNASRAEWHERLAQE